MDRGPDGWNGGQTDGPGAKPAKRARRGRLRAGTFLRGQAKKARVSARACACACVRARRRACVRAFMCGRVRASPCQQLRACVRVHACEGARACAGGACMLV